MDFLTVKQVCEVSGVKPQALRNMVTYGLIEPAQAGTTGIGNGHRFSKSQALALYAGTRYREEGATDIRAAGVVKFLAGRPWEELEADIAAGRTFPVPGTLLKDNGILIELPGVMIKPPYDQVSPKVAAAMRRLDLKAVKEEIERRIARLARGKKKTVGAVP